LLSIPQRCFLSRRAAVSIAVIATTITVTVLILTIETIIILRWQQHTEC
jgi:hypothetical protein